MEFAAILTTRLRPTVREEVTCGALASPDRAEYRSQLKECERLLRSNETLFNLETEDCMIESRIYEREALLCRHKYLLEKMREG